MNRSLRTLSSEVVYSGRVISLVKDMVILPSGRKTVREKVIHRGSVGVLPVLKDGRVVLVEQFRYVVGSTLLEIPAGTIEGGESPEECAKRELLEETGYRADRLDLLASFYLAPGYSNEFMWLFKASGLKAGTSRPMPDEDISVKKVKIAEAYELVKNGSIKDVKTICAILLYIDVERAEPAKVL